MRQWLLIMFFGSMAYALGLMTGCESVQRVAEPVAVGEAIKYYCTSRDVSERELFRANANAAAAPHTIKVECAK